jgi:hypothetical protein
MANNSTTQKHDPDVRRDFETGTVNPGPGMAPPHRADDIPAGSMSGATEIENDQKEKKGSCGMNKKQESNDSGSCGCG